MHIIDEKSVIQVSELNRLVKDQLETGFTEIRVEGEISNLIRASSGHCYFSLKDNQAQVRCAMFRGSHRQQQVTLANGVKIIAYAKVTLYEARGDYQLIVNRVDDAGIGALHLAYEKLKQKLAIEGLFAAEYKKPLPTYPKIIGIITSPTGAAIRDIISTCRRRFPSTRLMVYPCLVQGKEAGHQISEALSLANRHQVCDVLIVGRGGGSLEDLWSFNEEIVARAIFASHIPIVSAVGHEIDFTIADFVADTRAATPTAAAELLTPDSASWLYTLNRLQERLQCSMQKKISHASEKLVWLSKRLQHPKDRLDQLKQRIDEYEIRLREKISRLIEQKQYRLNLAAGALHHFSPLATLDRGYAIVQTETEKRVIRTYHEASIHTLLSIRLSSGSLVAEVKKIIPPTM